MTSENARDPATGELYDPTSIETELVLQRPLTGFCYDRLQRAMKTAQVGEMALLDNVLTRLEAATTSKSQPIPQLHRDTPVRVPLRIPAEVDAVRAAFTVPEGTCVAPLCRAVRSQLPAPDS